MPDTTAKNKGKGKGKPRVKASKEAKAKTKYSGVHTRFQAKQERVARERLGIDKLLSTSRNLVDEPELIDPNETDRPTQPLLGHFSSHDLIHSSIAEPQLFDESVSQTPLSDEIIIISHDNEVPRTEASSVNTRWNFSLNPLSYFQRSDGTDSNCAFANNVDLRNASQETDQHNVSISSPQCTSTPTDVEETSP